MKTFESQWRARFERWARLFEGDADISGWSEAGLQQRLRRFASLLPDLALPAGARVLDVGCGAGTYVRLLGGLGHCAAGLDYSLPSLQRARAADPGGKGSYVGGDSYQLPVRSGRVDLVLAIGILQALSDPERALDEMARVLRPGGTLVVEALNARGLATHARHLAQALRGWNSGVRVYDPRAVRGWLARRGLDLRQQVGLCLPPRRFPRLASVLDNPWIHRVLERRGPVAALAAHTFLFVAVKRG